MSDPVWHAFVELLLDEGPVRECRSRYGDKPALRLGGREIAHSEAPGCLDLRITRDGWRRVRDLYAADPAVTKLPARADWLEIRLESPEALNNYDRILRTLVESNR